MQEKKIAEQYIDFLTQGDEVSTLTWQLIPEQKDQLQKQARILHGPLEKHWRRLCDYNDAGWGVFLMVNEGDGEGRAAKNVRKVRAVFVDLDGPDLSACLTNKIEPQLIVESSPGRYHLYFLVDEFPLAEFSRVQKLLAQKFGGDPSVHDLARVMRVPGFLHKKNQPFLTRIIPL